MQPWPKDSFTLDAMRS